VGWNTKRKACSGGKGLVIA